MCRAVGTESACPWRLKFICLYTRLLVALLLPSASVQPGASTFLPPPFFLLFRAAFEAYGGSQVGGQIGAVAASLHHSHSNARSVTYAEACGNDGSLTHGTMPGLETVSSWILVGGVTQ